MLQTAVLASGSKGNAIFVRSGSTRILLDAGLSGRELIRLLESVTPQAMPQALVISHEHSDHVRGAGIISRKLDIPIYMSEPTYLSTQKRLGKLKHPVMFFQPGKPFPIGDLKLQPFEVSHDSVDCAGFVIESPDFRRLGIATDLGYATHLVAQRLQNLHGLILESNHDVRMLLDGPYPWQLKQRVRSRQGHLSNEQAVGLFSQVVHGGLGQLILAHLSETNNLPELALRGMSEYLDSIRLPLCPLVASQNQPTPLIEV